MEQSEWAQREKEVANVRRSIRRANAMRREHLKKMYEKWPTSLGSVVLAGTEPEVIRLREIERDIFDLNDALVAARGRARGYFSTPAVENSVEKPVNTEEKQE